MEKLQSIKDPQIKQVNGVNYIILYKTHNRYTEKFCDYCNKTVRNYYAHKKSKRHLINCGEAYRTCPKSTKAYNKSYYAKNKSNNHLKRVHCKDCDCYITKASFLKHTRTKKHMRNSST